VWLFGFLVGLWWADLMEDMDKRKPPGDLIIHHRVVEPNWAEIAAAAKEYEPPVVPDAFKPKPRLTIVKRRTHEGM
jgi:hypothetical protein